MLEAILAQKACQQVGEDAHGLSEPVTVNVADLFEGLTFDSAVELQLSAGQLLSQVSTTSDGQALLLWQR